VCACFISLQKFHRIDLHRARRKETEAAVDPMRETLAMMTPEKKLDGSFSLYARRRGNGVDEFFVGRLPS
jgi:hypothetical protein